MNAAFQEAMCGRDDEGTQPAQSVYLPQKQKGQTGMPEFIATEILDLEPRDLK